MILPYSSDVKKIYVFIMLKQLYYRHFILTKSIQKGDIYIYKTKLEFHLRKFNYANRCYITTNENSFYLKILQILKPSKYKNKNELTCKFKIFVFLTIFRNGTLKEIFPKKLKLQNMMMRHSTKDSDYSLSLI